MLLCESTILNTEPLPEFPRFGTKLQKGNFHYAKVMVMYTKMKNSVKNTSLVLLFALFISCTASCSSGETLVGNTDTALPDTAADTTAAAEPDYFEDILSEADYNGYKFRMYIRTGEEWQRELYVEEADGDIMNDAIYARNSAVEEKYNIQIEKIDAADTFGTGADRAILAGEDAYDLVAAHSRNSFSYAHNKLVLDWFTDMPNVDLSQPWWVQDAINEFSLGGQLYVTVGDISYMDFGASCGMVFNKRIITDNNLDNPYRLVLDGKWTFDKFAEMSRAASADINGDSVYDIDNDAFGYVTGIWYGPSLVLRSAGGRVARNNNSMMELCLNNPYTVLAYEKFFNFIETDAAEVMNSGDIVEMSKPFIEGRALFYDIKISETIRLRNMDDDFGIIPWPKLDETIDTYYVSAGAGSSAFTVPITVSDTERTSLIVESLAYLGHRDVIPEYFNVVLTTKYARDDDSAAMLDMMIGSRIYDVAFFYDQSYMTDLASCGTNMFTKKNYNFASYYASLESATIKKIDKINQNYAE